MKHYGAEPPWHGELSNNSLGYWVRIVRDPEDWFHEPDHWEWRPPRTLMQRMGIILQSYYRPAIDNMLQNELLTARLR